MSRHTPNMATPRAAWVTPSDQRQRDTGYRIDPDLAISQATKDRQDAYAKKAAADLLGPVTALDAWAAYDLTEHQARAWIQSRPCRNHLTVGRVMNHPGLRVKAGRAAIKEQ